MSVMHSRNTNLKDRYMGDSEDTLYERIIPIRKNAFNPLAGKLHFQGGKLQTAKYYHTENMQLPHFFGFFALDSGK